MLASRELEGEALEQAKAEWFRALGDVVMHAGNLVKIGAHKQIANRAGRNLCVACHYPPHITEERAWWTYFHKSR